MRQVTTISIDKFELEPRNNVVFHASNELVVFKQSNLIKVSDCDGNVKNAIIAPPDWRYFESIEMSDSVVIIFGGRDVVIFSKYNDQPINYKLDIHKIGRCVTPLILGFKQNEIIFGTNNRGGLQTVGFDVYKQNRLYQTATIKMEQFNDLFLHKDHIYSLLDNTYITCSSIETGETIWKRFETSAIKSKLQILKNNLVYSCQGMIKQTPDGKKISNLKIPFCKVSSIEHVSKDRIYFTHNNNKNLMCYNNKESKTEWELPNLTPIKQSVFVNGLFGKAVHELLLIRSDEQFLIIDLTSKQIIYKTTSIGINRIRQVGNHILIHRNNQTDLIPGV